MQAPSCGSGQHEVIGRRRGRRGDTRLDAVQCCAIQAHSGDFRHGSIFPRGGRFFGLVILQGFSGAPTRSFKVDGSSVQLLADMPGFSRNGEHAVVQVQELAAASLDAGIGYDKPRSHT